jgi:CIC family chloride channel protein
VLSLSERHTKLLLACGAAGGIAATFNAPIAGMFFAVEVLLRHFTTRNFSIVLLASVVATVVAQAFHGGGAVIPIPEYKLQSPLIEIPLYALLGAVSGISGIGFTRALYWAEDRFSDLPFPPLVLMPVIGGLSVGVLALFSDDVLGLSESAMDSALNGNSAVRTMALLFVLKFVATALTIGSGGSGGVFRPSLTMGSMIGGVFGGAANRLLPGLTAASGAYATVGMAAMFAGAARAPVTSVLILFEMTRDYSIVLPVMTAVAVATLVSHMLSEGTIYTIKLARRGIEIQEDRPAISVMQALRVADAMSPATATVSRDTPVSEVVEVLGSQSEILALVLDDDGELYGVITHVDLNNAIAIGNYEKAAADICTTNVGTAFLDETLHQALARISDYDVHALPVVRRGAPKRPIGVLRRSDITRTYLKEMERRESAISRLAALDSDVSSDEVRSIDVRVLAGSQLNGKLLSESRLPEGAILVTVRHNGVTQIPHGTTRLQAGDEVTVALTERAMDEVLGMFGGANSGRSIG